MEKNSLFALKEEKEKTNQKNRVAQSESKHVSSCAPSYVNPLKFCCNVSDKGADCFGIESTGNASVNTGSKFDTSDSDC